MNRIPFASALAMGSITAALLLMTSALDHPFVASAEPNNGSNVNEWDIEKYDACMSHMPGDVEPVSWDMYCCTNSGGMWDHNKHICAAPPADAQPIGGIPPNRIPTTVLLPPPSTPEAPPPGSVG